MVQKDEADLSEPLSRSHLPPLPLPLPHPPPPPTCEHISWADGVAGDLSLPLKTPPPPSPPPAATRHPPPHPPVSTYPGQMALQVMLARASSRPTVRVNPATPCLAAL